MNPTDQNQERHLFRFLMANIPDRIYFKDMESRFISVNAAMTRLFNLKGPEEAVGRSDFDFFPKADAQRMYDDEMQVVRTGEPILAKVESKVLPDGSRGWTLTTKLPLRGSGGEIIGTCGISKDITSLKAAEEALEHERNRLRMANAELSRSQAMLERKLAELEKTHAALKEAQVRLVEVEKAQSIGSLALGVAHEVKNPLAIIKMGVDFFSGNAVDAETGAIVLKEMNDAVLRADSVINELMVFSDSRDLTLTAIALSDIIESALDHFAEKLASSDIQVVKQYSSGLPMVRVDVERVRQVFMCLVENAIDAMRGGGVLKIRIGITHILGPGAVQDKGGRSIVHSGVRRIGVVTEIDDTGHGIPPDKLANIFDPFFTTKATGEGTGLGLTVSRKVIERHGGTIEIMNRTDGGVCARVLLKV